LFDSLALLADAARGGMTMNQQRPTNPKAERVEKKDLDDRGHGDKLDAAVDRVTKASKRPQDSKGDEIME
jgi:hypothetical protein